MKSCVQAVIISCGSRENSIVGKEVLTTESSFTISSHIVSPPKALAQVKLIEALDIITGNNIGNCEPLLQIWRTEDGYDCGVAGFQILSGRVFPSF